MRTLLQRVSRAAVHVEGVCIASIARGALLLVGVERGDGQAEVEATVKKVAALRFFPGRSPMDKTLAEVGGACLVVSQFTLLASLTRGNRPGFEAAEEPEQARTLYESVADGLAATGLLVARGQFAAHMEVSLVNEGPVTLWIQVRDGRVVS